MQALDHCHSPRHVMHSLPDDMTSYAPIQEGDGTVIIRTNGFLNDMAATICLHEHTSSFHL